jgi:NitT/TauT family transport system ATP-binding protein
VSRAPAEIVFERVSKMFPSADGAYAVRELSFTVERGELIAILGKTGCGKSTTFNLLAGLQQPTEGTIRVQGKDPYRDFDWFRGKIGIVFQNDRLMPWRTAIQNVALGLELNRGSRAERLADAARWLDRLGLGGHENDYPHALSGGMRQRVSIARAFAVKPEILLCDEPFSSLDQVTGDQLRAEFRELVRETKATGIFITHSVDEALELGRRVMVFHRPARIAFEATLDADTSDLARNAVRAGILDALARDKVN